MKIEWLETFELGVPEIDGDHRTMVHIMHAIERAHEARQKTACIALVERLFKFTEDHFRREETLLRAWGYGEVHPHCRYHRELMDNAERIRKTCAEAESETAFEKCCDEMMRFLIDDVVRGDLNLKSFLDYTGITIPRPA